TGLIAGKPAPTVDLCTPDLWALALPAIERKAVVIQATPDVLAVPAPSLASQRSSAQRSQFRQH
ncbi:hypothetical protein, partial [Pseudomonas wadenswilerensis]|uniref:hypothetical protein n=1 Tax=Pseudomonas wadenswilerensis TaxID=1785161 RepID=UPI0039EF87CC